MEVVITILPQAIAGMELPGRPNLSRGFELAWKAPRDEESVGNKASAGRHGEPMLPLLGMFELTKQFPCSRQEDISMCRVS
jgi:hypothetical protein